MRTLLSHIPMWLAIVTVLAVLAVLTVFAPYLVTLHERNSNCESMGEVWQDEHHLPDGSFMPGQCVDPDGGNLRAMGDPFAGHPMYCKCYHHS